MLHDNKPCGIIVTTEGWVHCPVCKQNKRLLRVLPDTTATCLPVYCKRCRREVVLNICPRAESLRAESQ